MVGTNWSGRIIVLMVGDVAVPDVGAAECGGLKAKASRRPDGCALLFGGFGFDSRDAATETLKIESGKVDVPIAFHVGVDAQSRMNLGAAVRLPHSSARTARIQVDGIES